jgi:hypothetical protein
VIHGRALMGTVSDENEAYSDFPGNQIETLLPYYEAGVGVENIFKFIRVDAIWRLTHKNQQQGRNFGVFISMAFSF